MHTVISVILLSIYLLLESFCCLLIQSSLLESQFDFLLFRFKKCLGFFNIFFILFFDHGHNMFSIVTVFGLKVSFFKLGSLV
jgi:hypothetical protein